MKLVSKPKHSAAASIASYEYWLNVPSSTRPMSVTRRTEKPSGAVTPAAVASSHSSSSVRSVAGSASPPPSSSSAAVVVSVVSSLLPASSSSSSSPPHAATVSARTAPIAMQLLESSTPSPAPPPPRAPRSARAPQDSAHTIAGSRERWGRVGLRRCFVSRDLGGHGRGDRRVVLSEREIGRHGPAAGRVPDGGEHVRSDRRTRRAAQSPAPTR